MERERETSAALESLTPVFEAPGVWVQRPFGSGEGGVEGRLVCGAVWVWEGGVWCMV